MRIVSLVPSVTETLSAWDRTPIACTRFCERDDLEHVGGTKNPDIERIIALSPDLVVVEAEENRREDYEALVEAGLDVLALQVRSLSDVNVAMAYLATRVQVTWHDIDFAPSAVRISRAFIPIWRRPWMALGVPTYGADLLARLGVSTIYDDLGPYPRVELEAVLEREPDVVLAPSEPYSFGERHRAELESIAPTYFVDGKDLFWWGERSRLAPAHLADQLRVVL